MQLLQRVIFCKFLKISTKKKHPIDRSDAVWRICNKLLLDDLQDLHGAGLHADAAGDALGGCAVLGSDHNLHGADLHALAASGAELLVDHIDTGLGVLGNSTSLANLSALAALDAGHGLCSTVLLNDTDAGQIFIEFLVESHRTSTHTLQACHALNIFLNGKSFHNDIFPLILYSELL